MAEQDFYEIARQQIDKRNRLIIAWTVHLAAFVVYAGLFIMISMIEFSPLSLFVLIAWGGIFIMHTIIATLLSSREEEIAKEAAKLRATYGVHEKPKRLELTQDGEFIGFSDDGEAQQMQRR